MLESLSASALCGLITLIGGQASVGADDRLPRRLPPVLGLVADSRETGVSSASESSAWRVPESIWGSRVVPWSDASNADRGEPTSVSGPTQVPVLDDEVQLKKRNLARNVSEQILVHPKVTQSGDLPVARSVSVTARQQLDWALNALSKAEELASRGAFYGARQHARESLMHFATASDIQKATAGIELKGTQATDQVRQALQAIREAGDFVGRFGSVDQAGCERMILSHETTVLKSNSSGMSGHAAAGLYLDFARQNLSRALCDHPDARRALTVLGKCEAQCDENPEGVRLGIQLCCFRAAVALGPGDGELLRQFGALCLSSGLLSEGQWALEQAVFVSGDSKASLALMEHYSRTGNHSAAVKLQGHMATLQRAEATPEKTIFLVTPEQFASISPPVQLGGTRGDPTLMFAGPRNSGFASGSQVLANGDENANLQRPDYVSANRRPGGPYDGGAGNSLKRETPRPDASVYGNNAGTDAIEAQQQAEGFWGRLAGQLRTVFQ